MSVYQEHSTTQCGLRPVVDDQGRPRTTGTRVHVCTRGCKLSTVDACSNKSTCATTSTAHAKRFDLLALEPCHRGEHKLGATRDPPNPIFHCGLDIWRNRRNPVRRIDPLVPSRAVLTGVSRCPRAHPHTQHCPVSLNKRFLDAGIATSGTMKRLPDGPTEKNTDIDLPRNDHLSKVIIDPIGPRHLARVVVFGGHLVKCSTQLSSRHI